MMQITLNNGIVLDDSLRSAPDLAKYARDKGLDGIRVFCTSKNTYLLVDGDVPEYESQSSEAIAVHIDIMVLAKTGDDVDHVDI